MTTTTIRWKDSEQSLPGIRGLWRAIKADTGTRVRSPKSIRVTDTAEPMCPNDSSCCRRYAVDLATMKIVDRVHVSAGEWACTTRNPDGAVGAIPQTHALVSCEWSDYYRFFSLTIQVAPGCLPRQIAA